VCIDKVYKYKFDRGSTNLFRIIGEDVGNLSFIVVEVHKDRVFYINFTNGIVFRLEA
jgi:hypothetical protein